jgi:hypothetical protein
MTTTIHLEYEGKTARLPLQSPKSANEKQVMHRRTSSGIVTNTRVFNAASKVSAAAFTADDLVKADPELDLSLAGMVADTDLLCPAFLDGAGTVVQDFEEIEVVLGVDGAEKERRPRTKRSANINDVRPLKVGKFMPAEEALTSFVIRAVYQIVHSDGLGHEFLRGLAEKLQSEKAIAILGAGPKGNLPLVLKEKGSPYRAFLHGEIGEDESYRLLLLLSNQELKFPA